MKWNVVLSMLFLLIGVFCMFISTKKKYKKLYFYRTISYVFFLTACFFCIVELINISKVVKSLETITTISATIAGFVFAGISIMLALLNTEYIRILFQNDFLDKVFYKAYSVVALSIIDVALYVASIQFNILSYQGIVLFYLYIFWISLLLFMLMLYDFAMTISRAKKERTRE